MMIQTMYLVTPHDTINELFVLRRIDQSGKLAVRNEYKDLVCKRCRKVDERAALARGIQQEMVMRSKRPFVLSTDYFYLVDDRGKQVIEGILPDLLDFTPIPGTKYCVSSPKLWLQPDESDPGFRFVGTRCPECHRPREVVWGKVPPKVGDTPRVFAINLEGQSGARAVWLVSKEVADELKKVLSKLTGMAIRPKEVDDGEPN